MNMQRIGGVVVIAALVMASCSSAGYVDGPVLTSERPSLLGGEGMDAIVGGTVTLDDGCLYLVSGDVAVPVLWPHGTSWNDDAPAVILDDVEVEPGMQVTGSGGYVPLDRVRLATAFGAAVAAAAEACAGPTGEIAVFNAGSDVSVTND